MYEQLIANLRAVDEYDTGYAKLIWEAADAIEHMQKTILRLENELGIYDDLPMVDQSMVLSKMEKTTQWIPVTERFPEKDTHVIVCASLPEGVHSDFIYEDGHWFVSIGVTHWMPLPEPPKEET